MREFLEFPVEATLPRLNFKLAVQLLHPDRTESWEVDEAAFERHRLKILWRSCPAVSLWAKVLSMRHMISVSVSLTLSSRTCKQPGT